MRVKPAAQAFLVSSLARPTVVHRRSPSFLLARGENDVVVHRRGATFLLARGGRSFLEGVARSATDHSVAAERLPDGGVRFTIDAGGHFSLDAGSDAG